MLAGNENDLLIQNYIILFSVCLHYGCALPLSPCTECFPSVSVMLMVDSSVIVGCWWWSTEWCGDSSGTGWDGCECSGIVSEWVNSSGVRKTLCSEGGDGGITSVLTWSVSDSPMGINGGSDKELVDNAWCVCRVELSAILVSAIEALLSVASVAWGQRM